MEEETTPYYSDTNPLFLYKRLNLAQIIQRIFNRSMYYKSFNKVQITQRSSNHSRKYKPFNVLYKSFNIVQII